MRAWFAIAVLAGSWLLGLGYFQPASPFSWLCLVAVGVVLLSEIPLRLPERGLAIATVPLVVPSMFLAPLPYKVIPILFGVGILLCRTPIPRRWPRRTGRGMIVAGAILFAQSAILWCYQLLTARAHELPWPLATLPHLAARVMGADAARDGASVAFRSSLSPLRIAATWELLFDPATICFVVGGLALLLIKACASSRPVETRSILRSSLILLGITLVWSLLRMAFLIALVLHMVLRADPVTYPNVGELLVSTWLHIALLGPLALLSALLVPDFVRLNNRRQQSEGSPTVAQLAGPLALVTAGVALLVWLYTFEPVGSPKGGRICVMERHSTWEPTTEPYRTKVYGEAGSYNYAAIYEYCGQYYEMAQLLESNSIDDRTLSDCDVLIVKTPTARYSADEVTAIVNYVQHGGSLLLIGDHTNVFNMNTYLNDISRHFGLTFRNDLLFRIGSPYKQKYYPPRVAHPIVQRVPPMNFAVSCSIDPGISWGTMVIRNTGLYNLPPAYHESNYHPQAEYQPNMQYGAWCQMWATTYGKGRVVAFADSTLFSNFCVFQPGKTELFMGMIDWLNRTSPLDRLAWRFPLALALASVATVLIGWGLVRLRFNRAAWIPLTAAWWLGWSIASAATMWYSQAAMSAPPAQRHMPHVIIDRTLSEVPLFTGAFADDPEGLGYGMLEQWIPRVGNCIERRAGDDIFTTDGLVVICPTRPASEEYRQQLLQFVERGGQLLVIDSLAVENSTANSILWPFGLASNHDVPQSTEMPLRLGEQATEVIPEASCGISGGDTLAWWGELPVAASTRYGLGTVTAIGFGSLFNDGNMGFHWLPEPEAPTLARYELLYSVLRAALPHEE